MRSLTLRLPVSSTAGPIATRLPFPLDLYPIAWQEGIQREKVWLCPVRQDKAVHRRSEVRRTCAPLASLPWLTVGIFGFPSMPPPTFSFLDVRKYMLISIYYVDYVIIS